MDNYMSMGGRTISVPSGGGRPRPYDQTDQGIIEYNNRLRREQEEREEANRRRNQGGDVGYIMQMLGGGQQGAASNPGDYGAIGGRGRVGGGGGSMGAGAPYMSGVPGRSYKTRGSAPQYHEQIPMGGTRGVYAIRNDEIAGPQRDAPWIDAARRRHQSRRGRFGR